MIAVDTCVIVAFLEGESGPDVEALAGLMESDGVALPPSVVTELLSDPKGGAQAVEIVGGLSRLGLEAGYWERAGALRAAVKRSGRKAALGDALIAQACIDANTPLLTRDSDFKGFAAVSGLKLAI